MDEIIEYLKQRDKELDDVAVLDDGTYSSAKETYAKLIDMLKKLDYELNIINVKTE